MTLTITQRQAEQTEVESTEEYIIDQKLLEFDERLATLKARFAANRDHDRAFARLMRLAYKEGRCPYCNN